MFSRKRDDMWRFGAVGWDIFVIVRFVGKRLGERTEKTRDYVEAEIAIDDCW